ncbi:MAG TPA: hypothetical protein DDW65_02860 [Firmicutes bacterium]|nr:hypothetical protein [Bacillota bacterium]
MIKWFNNLNIQIKLVITYSGLILLPLLILGVISYYISAGTIETQAIQFSNKIVSQINRNLDYNIKEMERISLTPFSDPDVQMVLRKSAYHNDLEKLRDRQIMDKTLFNLITLRPDIMGIYIFPQHSSSNQEVYYRTNGYSMRDDYDLTKELWYPLVLWADGKKVLLSTHYETQPIHSPRKVFSLARQIKDVDHYQNLGFILIDANLKIIQEICENSNFGQNGKIMIVDQHGNIVYHTDETKIGAKLEPKFQQFLSNQNINRMLKIAGEKMLVSSAVSAYTHWTVIGMIPLAELNRSTILIRNITIFIGLICLLLGVIVSIFIAKGISNPIRKLQRLMSQAEQGNFNLQMKLDHQDEIGQLTHSFNIMITKIKELINTVYDAQLVKKEAELAALQSQINPHFLYNTLEVIRGIAMTNKITSIVDISKSLAKLFRYSIHKEMEYVTLAEEIAHVKNYLTIQKYRYGDKIEVIYQIDEQILKQKSIKLILQPLVENAIYHGLETKIGKGRIEISGYQEAQDILIKIRDDGLGMSREQLDSLSQAMNSDQKWINDSKQTNLGIGVMNVNSRIKLHYGNNYSLKIESEPNKGTTVIIRIPALV